MLVDEKIKVRWARRNKNWYTSKGYSFTNFGDEFYAGIKDLPPTSQAKVRVTCDYCGVEKESQYVAYLRNKMYTAKDACMNCAGHKISETRRGY